MLPAKKTTVNLYFHGLFLFPCSKTQAMPSLGFVLHSAWHEEKLHMCAMHGLYNEYEFT